MNEVIEESNFLLYAAKHYKNDGCYDDAEFYDDLNRFKYLKRLFKRFQETGDLKERLILNHLVVLYNVFDNDAMTKMLFFKLDEFLPELKPFLILIGRMPPKVESVGSVTRTLYDSDIRMNMEIVERLRSI